MDDTIALEQRKEALMEKYRQATVLQYFALGKLRGLAQRAANHDGAHDSHAHDVDLLAGFSAEELDMLEAFFDRIVDNLKASIGPADVERLQRKREERIEYLHTRFGEGGEAFTRIADEIISLNRNMFGTHPHAAQDGQQVHAAPGTTATPTADKKETN